MRHPDKLCRLGAGGPTIGTARLIEDEGGIHVEIFIDSFFKGTSAELAELAQPLSFYVPN